MHRIALRLLTGSGVAIALAACSGGGASQADIEARIAAQIVEEGLGAKEAACFAGVLVDQIGVDELKDVDFSADAPPADLQNDLIAASAKAIERCDIDPSSLTD